MFARAKEKKMENEKNEKWACGSTKSFFFFFLSSFGEKKKEKKGRKKKTSSSIHLFLPEVKKKDKRE
jgi:hypothetical protein